MELTEIKKFIAMNNIKPDDFSYHTWRDIEEDGVSKGKIRILVLKKDNIARTEFICPACGKHDYKEKEWERPFSVKCDCGNTIKVPKLRDQAKREMKSRKD